MKQPNWIVTKVTPLDNYILELSFISGETKHFDCKPLLEKGIFRKLKNPAFFQKAHVVGPTVAWNDDIDIAPETLYSDSIAF